MQRAESREQSAENRVQRTESREQRAENRVQRTVIATYWFKSLRREMDRSEAVRGCREQRAGSREQRTECRE